MNSNIKMVNNVLFTLEVMTVGRRIFSSFEYVRYVVIVRRQPNCTSLEELKSCL